jgi:hypothetical protein
MTTPLIDTLIVIGGVFTVIGVPLWFYLAYHWSKPTR